MFQDAAIAVQMPVSSIKKFLAAWALVHQKVFMVQYAPLACW
jgi:hypothetical protein